MILMLQIWRLGFKEVKDMPSFTPPLINGEQTFGEDQNVSIIGSDICPFDI